MGNLMPRSSAAGFFTFQKISKLLISDQDIRYISDSRLLTLVGRFVILHLSSNCWKGVTCMEKKTQLSVILTNAPGELSKMCDVLKAANINILAMSIQNAKDSVKELFNMREKTGRRIALAESYRGILKDSSDYSLIRILVDHPRKAEEELLKSKHLVSKDHVLVFKLLNKPGMLGKIAKRFGEASVNIDYIYGSTTEDCQDAMFILRIAESDFDRVKDFAKDL
ncbi:MAG: ACT domain-containing protein [Deltaproteobacteria bacterium]|nr:ACT domain-containing protein [Deltaproteobacteria bacterium]